MNAKHETWLASLEPGITAARDRLAAARRRMDEVLTDWETRPYDEDRMEALLEASDELDDATCVGQEFVLAFVPETKARRRRA